MFNYLIAASNMSLLFATSFSVCIIKHVAISTREIAISSARELKLFSAAMRKM